MSYLKDELQGFVPTQVASQIVKDVTRGSSVLRLSRVEPMTSDKNKFPVMTSGAGAYWVGEAERIQTSTATWIFPELYDKKLGVISSVTKEKLNDTTIDVFAELKPTIAEVSYTAIDSACLFGTNSPFDKNIVSSAMAVGNVVEIGTNNPNADGKAHLDLDISDTISALIVLYF